MQITQAITDLGAFARNEPRKGAAVEIRKTPSNTGPSIYELRSGKTRGTADLGPGVWAPGTYVPWARTAFSAADSAVPEVLTPEAAEALLSPGLEVFLKENERISKFLNEHPRSSHGHLQAALLTGTIALNGYQTRSFDQYLTIRELSEEPAISMIVWDGKTYRLSEGKIQGRRFGVDMADYSR